MLHHVADAVQLFIHLFFCPFYKEEPDPPWHRLQGRIHSNYRPQYKVILLKTYRSRFGRITYADDGIKVVELKCAIDISVPFTSNYRNFLGSCLPS